MELCSFPLLILFTGRIKEGSIKKIGGKIFFIEVKTYDKKYLSTSEQNFDQNKLKKLKEAIDKYDVDMKVKKDISVDFICVYLQALPPKFKHFKCISLDV